MTKTANSQAENVKLQKHSAHTPKTEAEESQPEQESPPAAFARVANGPKSAIRPTDIFTLQRTVGNQAVQRLLAQRDLIAHGDTTRSDPRTVEHSAKIETEKRQPVASDTLQRYAQTEIELDPHPRQEPTGDSKPIQRFAAKTFTIGGGSVTGTLSENGKYFIPSGPIQSNFIYATSVPNYCSQVGSSTYSFNSKTYAKYAPANQFLDDCLHSAEEIVNGKILSYGSGTYTRETTTNYVFGQSDKRNIEIAETAKSFSVGSVNGSADAGTGNAFVIVDTEFETKPSKRSPYHAAGVIGVDGSDRITMEVFASGGSTVRRETDALLSMYTVGGGGASFHGYWSGGYFSGFNTITIVIKAK